MAPNFNIAHCPIKTPTVGENGWQDFNPHTQLLKKGDRPFGARAIDCDITIEHDVEIVVRDGARLYVDVYRPTNASGPVPAILSYSPFGKKYSGLIFMPKLPYGVGVTSEDVSGLEKFEGIDPARWCARDFAVISVDARGTGSSDGVVHIMGSQESEDGYDVIEAIAKKEWCNGSVALAGNSHLAIIQWFIAALNPPSLKAIAPWEGCSDMYREQFVRGGIFDISNFQNIIDFNIRGKIGVEDFTEMYRRTDQGIIDAYWADKRPDMSKIRVPTYITGSEFSAIHTMGAVRGWMQLGTEDKWLRWTGVQEWHDLWSIEETNEDLMDFFDHFLKGKENGWKEKTPKVRMSLLQFGKREPIDMVVPDFPIPDTDHRSLYFGENGTLSSTAPSNTSIVTYDSENKDDKVAFTIKFDKQTRLVGLPKAVVYMSCDDLDDLCVRVRLRKLDANGKVLRHCTIPFSRVPFTDPDEAIDSTLIIHHGSVGLLRASHRHIDHTKSMHPQYPFHPHDRVEKVTPGTVVRLEIGIWAMSVHYDAGESLAVEISASSGLWPDLGDESAPFETNKGVHKVHFGGEYPSHVILPFTNL